ncbi:hypothetical protein RS030_213352 [Cryptosporidium xiaoi]|uniref:CCAAT-binding factor domain-containing protein n=1 Tax=Cryptosporidium xiaoi TaxID=659607 RepID=A0AAV9XXC0_9CRYT
MSKIYNQLIDKLLEACKTAKLKSVTLINILKDINKTISDIKKENMEITPIDLLGNSNNYLGSTDINLNYCEPIVKLRDSVKFCLRIFSIVMGITPEGSDELLKNEVFMSCINSNRKNLRIYVIQLLFKWLKDDILIREYRNMKDKGNFNNVLNYPVSLSTYIIRCILLSSMGEDELKKIILDNKIIMPNETFTIENLLLSEYINRFKDLRCFFLKHIHNLIEKCVSENIPEFINAEQKELDKNGVKTLDRLTTISIRTYYILIKLSAPRVDEEFQDEEIMGDNLLFTLGIIEDEKYIEKVKKFDKEYRIIYQKLWLSFIRLILSKGNCIDQTVHIQILKSALEYVSETVIQIISNPLELADIFKSCYDGVYNSGDRIDDMDKLSLSIISLSGIFYLITNNRLSESSYLESSDDENISTGYYRRLYEIISPPIFFLKTRGRLFNLISVSLMSPLIPITVLCCFIKKLIRISVFTATNDTIWIISLVNVLINRQRNVLFPILSLNENDKEYSFVSDILSEVNGELWSYRSDINSYILKNTNLPCSFNNNSENELNTDTKNTNFIPNMGAYISANFGLWELYLLNRSVSPIIRNVCNTLTLNANNANVNRNIHDLRNEELAGLNSEDVLNHEISSHNGIISTYLSVIKKNKREYKDSNDIIPHNYIEDSDLSSFNINKSSEKFFTNSDSELLALI